MTVLSKFVLWLQMGEGSWVFALKQWSRYDENAIRRDSRLQGHDVHTLWDPVPTIELPGHHPSPILLFLMLSLHLHKVSSYFNHELLWVKVLHINLNGESTVVTIYLLRSSWVSSCWKEKFRRIRSKSTRNQWWNDPFPLDTTCG